jgi:carboxypeptidase Taq
MPVPSTAKAAYAELLKHSHEMTVLGTIGGLVSWDQNVLMPRQGTSWRGEQLALLSQLGHARLTDPRIGELLSVVEASPLIADRDGVAARNVRHLRRAYDRATKVPATLVAELSRVTTQAHEAWVDARKHNHFATFLPLLERIVALKREEAAAVSTKGMHPYEALLDEYEEGAKVADLQALFSTLTTELSPFVKALGKAKHKPKDSLLHRHFPLDRQKIFAEAAMRMLGFDFSRGRLDVSAHPFCTGLGPNDHRLTTRYDERFFPAAFFAALHETGHGLYEMHLPAALYGQPAGGACSLGIHESQSRLWENLVGRSEAFWQGMLPRVQQQFPDTLDDVSVSDWTLAVNQVKPSLIRVEADEVTYNLHIALRFELEVGLLTGDLKPRDLPGAWNSQMQKLLGIRPKTDTEGCLQDVHWSFGGLGYFPTYTLGNLYSAQFFEALTADLGGQKTVDEHLRRGEFLPIRTWLTKHVHQYGSTRTPAEICQAATGKKLSPKPFLTYLKRKFSRLYNL